ncbi:hypothetical protein TNCV_4429291 [Trichonephila clavipes]|nr:hypothetical protein TNCV_4429291 [Trichonephila clavipes]
MFLTWQDPYARIPPPPTQDAWVVRCTAGLEAAAAHWSRRGGVPAQVLSSSFDHGSKLCGPSPKALE